MPRTPSPAVSDRSRDLNLIPLASLHGHGTQPTLSGFNVKSLPYSRLSGMSKFSINALIVTLNLVQFISAFCTVGGGLKLSELLGREGGPSQANWMAASYSLTQGAVVLITGRLGAVYGHQRLMLIGALVFTLCSLGNVFCTTYDSFVAVRALTGIGGGLFMPNCVAVITLMVPPGRSRNITMGFFAASPPLGGTIGALLIGAFIKHGDWKWHFVLIASFSAAFLVPLTFLLPKEMILDPGGRIDYVGAVLGLSSLLLFNIAWNQAPSVGWSTGYEIAILVTSVVFFGIFVVWESKYASNPIMPLDIFGTPSFTALILVVLLSYMSVGIALWYGISWQQVFRGATVLQVGINFIPFGVASVFAVGLCAWMIPRFAAQWIMAIGVVVVLVSNLLLATMPLHQSYWPQMFPSMILAGFCPDFVYVAAQLIASNSVSPQHQGIASSLIGTLNLYGNSLGLGFAGTIEAEIKKSHQEVLGYRSALYFGAALALAGLLLDVGFVRVPKDKREGWDTTSGDESPEIREGRERTVEP